MSSDIEDRSNSEVNGTDSNVNGGTSVDGGATTTDDTKGVLSQSLFVQHLASYPAVAAVTGFAASFPVVKVFASNAVPLLQSIRERSQPVTEPVKTRASPILKRADKLGDDFLTTIDKTLPSRRRANASTESSDGTTTSDSGVGAANGGASTNDVTTSNASGYTSRATQAVNNGVVNPLRNVNSQLHNLSNNTVQFTRRHVNRIIIPVNERIEGIITDYLPKENESLPKVDSDSETYKTFVLTRVLLRRAGPALVEQASNAAQLPGVAQAHLREIYNDEKKKNTTEGSNRFAVSARAALGTGRELSVEGGQAISTALSAKRQIFWAPARIVLVHAEKGAADPQTNSVTKPVYQTVGYVLSWVVPKSQIEQAHSNGPLKSGNTTDTEALGEVEPIHS